MDNTNNIMQFMKIKALKGYNSFLNETQIDLDIDGNLIEFFPNKDRTIQEYIGMSLARIINSIDKNKSDVAMNNYLYYRAQLDTLELILKGEI